MDEDFLFNFLFSAFFTFMFYSFPIYIVRYVFLRRTIRRKTALMVVIPYGVVMFLVVKFIILASTGNVSRSNGASFFWSVFNYYILIGLHKKDRLEEPDNIAAESTLENVPLPDKKCVMAGYTGETVPESKLNASPSLNKKYVRKIKKEIKGILSKVPCFYHQRLTDCFDELWGPVRDILQETKPDNKINIRRDAYILLIMASNKLLNSGNYQYITGMLSEPGKSILAVCEHATTYARNSAYITDDDNLYQDARKTLDNLNADQLLDKIEYNQKQKDIAHASDTKTASISNNFYQEPLNDMVTNKERAKNPLNPERKYKRMVILFSLSQIVIVTLIITVVVLVIQVDDLYRECQYQKNLASYWFGEYIEVSDE